MTFASVMLEAARKLNTSDDPAEWGQPVYQAMVAALKTAGVVVNEAGTIRKDAATGKLIAEDWNFSFNSDVGMHACDRQLDLILLRRCHFEQTMVAPP